MTLADFAAQLRSGSALPWPGLSLDQAYAVAASNHRLRAAQDAPVGRKIGHTNPAHWAAQGIAAPSWGWLYASSTRPIERAQPPGHGREPKLELECVLRLARTPACAEDLPGCVDAMAIGLELVDRPYPSWPISVADSVAANGVHAALWLGPWQAFRAEALPNLKARLQLGDALSEGGSALVLGSPLAALARLMALLAEQGAPPLQGGEIVTTGALAPALPWTGAMLRAEVRGLGSLHWKPELA